MTYCLARKRAEEGRARGMEREKEGLLWRAFPYLSSYSNRFKERWIVRVYSFQLGRDIHREVSNRVSWLEIVADGSPPWVPLYRRVTKPDERQRRQVGSFYHLHSVFRI